MPPSSSPSSSQPDATKPLLIPSDSTSSSPPSYQGTDSSHPQFPQNDIPPPPSQSTSLRTRTGAAMFCFLILGLYTSTIGVVLPHLEQHYHLTDVQVSTIFLAAPVGYIVAAQLTARVNLHLGQRGIAVLGPLFQLCLAAVAAAHPPFPVLLAAVAAGNFGASLMDISWCAWAAGRPNANAISGLLHGSYSAGAAMGPVLAGAMIVKREGRWWEWYYVLLACTILELLILPLAFRHEGAAARSSRKDSKRRDPVLSVAGDDEEEAANRSTVVAAGAEKTLLSYPVLWICAAYLLTNAGTEVVISDWVVMYMLRARHATPYLASLCSSAFWVGMAVGRLALGPWTDRVGVRRAVIVYLCCGMATDVLFSVVTAPEIMPAVWMAMLGLFCGPQIPSAIVRLNAALPRELHVPAVSFVASLGQVGGAVLPFGLGALAQGWGIDRVFATVILVQMAVCLGIWMCFPKATEGSETYPATQEESEGLQWPGGDEE